MKTMAEVLQAHRYDNEKRTLHQHCTCGWAGKPLGFDFWEHQAAALSAAGFGLVADAKAEALQEAADKVMGPSDVLLDGATCRWVAMELRETAAHLRAVS